MHWTLLRSAMCLSLLSRAALAVDVPGTVPADFVVPIYRPIPAEGPDVLALDGTWRANRNPPAKVQEAALGGSQWSDFHVPGQWHAQQLPIGDETVAALGKDFKVPAAWRDKRIFLRFDAVHGGTVYWLNGAKLAATEHYWTPVELEITAQALPGETNRLRLTQTRNVFSEQIQFTGYRTQQQPPETGIPRSVRVFALPALHVSTLHVAADLDKDYRDGELLLELKLDNPLAKASEGLSLAVALNDPAGRPVAIDCDRFALSPLNPGASQRKFRLPVKTPLAWNAEKPALYTLTVDLRRNGQTLQRIWRRVGFRKIEVRGSQMLLNGRVLKLAGACHHEYDPFTQRSDTARHAESDVSWMKAANMNFARTTHYPPTAEFLDACDRLGLYAEVECPFMWTRIPAQDDPAHVRQFLAPTAAAVEYHRDHPSVILWSLANESGSKKPGSPQLPANYQATHKLVKRLDPTRLTSFHNEWDFDDRVPDVGNLHYPPMPFDGTTWIEGDPRPIMLGEAFITATDHWQGPLLRNDRGIHEEFFMDRNLYWFAWGLQPNPAQARWWQEHKPCGQNNPWNAWTHVYNSPRLLGMNLWEYGAHRCGFVDDWRRPKPEFWGMKRMLTPVYIPLRQVERRARSENPAHSHREPLLVHGPQ